MLHKNGDRLRAVYFPKGGVATITTILADGTAVEAATVGDEGMVGLEAFFGVDAIAPGEALIQVPDTSAEMMSVEDFRRESGAAGAFHDLIGHYAQVVIVQMMQSTACNALNPVPQRCARWLLMTHDRMSKTSISAMSSWRLCWACSGPPWSTVAAALQRAGLIRYTVVSSECSTVKG